MKVSCQGKAKGTPTGCGQGHLPGGRQYRGAGSSAKPGWLNKDTSRDWEVDRLKDESSQGLQGAILFRELDD